MRNRFIIFFRDENPIFVGECNYRDLSIERQCRILNSLYLTYKYKYYSTLISMGGMNNLLLKLNPMIYVDEMRLRSRYVLDPSKQFEFEHMLIT